MKKLILGVTLSALAFSCNSTKNSVDSKSKAPADPTKYGNTITSAELKEMLYIYASDEFEGRNTGEPGQKKAVEYLKQQYKNLEIPSPLSDDDYFQEVALEARKTPEVSIQLNNKNLLNLEDFISIGSPTTQSFSVNDIVYAGYGIEAENYSDYKNIDVKNKVVLIKAGEPKNEDGTYITTGKTENTTWSEGRRARSAKKNVASEKGAKAIIILDDVTFPRYAAYYKRVSNSQSKGRISLINNDSDLPQFMVNSTTAKAIYENILEDDQAKTINTSLSIDIKSEVTPVHSENVVAFIKGTEKPDEIVVISAHLDHEGVKDGKVYNGADDDGSGTVAILEIAEAFKTAVNDGYGPKRSILFLHVTGEEKGLLGSKYYTDSDPIFPLKNTVANLNIDMIGRVDEAHKDDRNYVYVIGSDMLSSELDSALQKANNNYTKMNLDYKYNNETDPNRFYYRSDHYNFAKNNIPVIFYYNGTHEDYHRPTDTPDKIEYDLLENRTRLVFYTAWEVANREQRLIVDKAKKD
ncbi:M28 family peptidase [Flavobacteriaceae bacterium 144Ye]|nr:M28 family peptidase [Flavobacteriaceae bacterium 144Ye]